VALRVQTEVSLKVKAGMEFLPVVTAFAEKASVALGLGGPESLAITLATEEVFVYLCAADPAHGPVDVRCWRGAYYVEEEFLFQARELNLAAFNLTAQPSLHSDRGFEDTGLLIASRMVDRFRVSTDDAGFHLTLVKEKNYPPLDETILPEPAALKSFSVRAPDPDELKVLIRLILKHHRKLILPPAFNFPGKVVDMAAAGELSALVAADSAGHLGGCILFRRLGMRMVEFFGPYLFNQPPGSGMARALGEACIAAVARSSIVGLISRYPSPDLPVEYFEALGDLTYRSPEGEPLEIGAYYRDMGEDPGSVVWTHPELEDFLRREYRRLFFAREIREARLEGEASSPNSVLAAEFDRGQGFVTLRPVWWGNDAEQTVNGYVKILCKEQIPCIFFEMDLGRAWQSHFATALVRNGFQPRVVIPYGGKGDLIIFQHSPGDCES